MSLLVSRSLLAFLSLTAPLLAQAPGALPGEAPHDPRAGFFPTDPALEQPDTEPLVLEGQVLHPDGRPAAGAVVVSSAGGLAEVREDGTFTLEVRVAPEVDSLQITAVANGSQGPLRAERPVSRSTNWEVERSGPMYLTSGSVCSPEWVPMPGQQGVNSHVHALSVFDDGTGAALFVGGGFATAAGQAVSYIAKWDGSIWSPLGAGVNNTVWAITVFDDGSGPALYAGGEFTSAGGQPANRIARWDGAAWSGLGDGVGGQSQPVVNALTGFDDGFGMALYVGGWFTTAGGQSAEYIAKWDGSIWSGLGSGLNNPVHDFAVFDDGAGGALYAGGAFTSAGGQGANRIARWDGSTWSPVGTGMNNSVFSLTVFNDGTGTALFAGGSFTNAGGQGANRIAKWDGQTWSALEAGMSGESFVWVRALAVFDDGSGPSLFAGGGFTMAGGQSANNIAKWDGSTWSAIGSGFSGGFTIVNALETFPQGGGNVLFAGGGFGVAGEREASNIAQWDGSVWSALGSGVNGHVYALTVFDDGSGPAIYAGGAFTSAGGQAANRIAKWDGSVWSALGNGMNAQVLALAVFNDGSGSMLYAAGSFTSADGKDINRIAKWNGSIWSPLGSGLSDLVLALTVFDDGSGPALYAGGYFTSAGGQDANRIAKWDGSVWSPLGSGVGNVLNTLAVFDDGSGPALYAGGDISIAGEQAVSNIAKWDGNSWSPLGSELNNHVYGLTVFNDSTGPALYAAGGFTIAGNQEAYQVAKWDGSVWSPLGTGLSGTVWPAWVETLKGYDDGSGPALYAGGWFTSAGGLATNRIAKWDGNAWSPLGSGLNSGVRALTVFDDGSGEALYVGGSFSVALGGDSFIAKWQGCPPLPQADLVFDPAGTGLPTEGIVDQVFEVRWRGRNDGLEVALGPWLDRIEFSVPIRQASFPWASVVALEVDGPAELLPSETYDRVASFLMPASATTFDISIRLDANDQVPETDITNNLFGPHTVTVHGLPLPNLRVEVTTQPVAGATAGDPVAVSFRVWNDGEVPTNVPQWVDRVSLVKGAQGGGPPASDGGALSSISLSNLSYLINDPGGDGSLAGSSYEHFAVALQVPPSAGTDVYYLAVRTNTAFAQPESNELDNLAFSDPIQVTALPLPDLAVENVGLLGIAPGTPLGSGTFVTVQWRVRNVGLGNFGGGGMTSRIYISPNQDTAGSDALASDRLLAQFNESLPPLGPTLDTVRSRVVFIPPDLTQTLPAPGEYAFKVHIDVHDAVSQDETSGTWPYWNNLAAGAGTHPVLLSSTPDLVAVAIGPVAGQGPAEVGHPLQVTWTVDNVGAEGWNIPLTWADQIWLSQGDDVLDAGDVLLGTFWHSTVKNAQDEWVIESYTKTRTVTIPQSTVPGTYHLILVTDAQDHVFEFSGGGEDNNETGSAPFTIDDNPADLAIVASAANGSIVAPTQGAPGQVITLPWTVTNVGPGATSASSWTDRVYLSPSETSLSGALTLLSRTHQGALAPGASYSEVRSAAVPQVAAGAGWWLHFVTDVHGAVYEGGASSSNSVAVPFQVTAIVADLVVAHVAATQVVRSGDSMGVSWTVRNDGPAATLASSWIDRVFLSDAEDLGQASALHTLGSVQRSAALGIGSSYDVSSSFAIPLGTTPGPWWVVVKTDANNNVFELDEGNNTRATKSLVDIDGSGGQGWMPANLVPRNVQILNSPVTAGQAVQLSWELANEGPGATDVSFWTDRVFLSLDAVLDPSDLAIGHHAHTTFLAAGEVAQVTAELVVPLGANGTWVVLVQADSGGAVYQGGATADDVAIASTLLQVELPPPTNLSVISTDLPSQVFLGEVLEFTWTTSNDSPTPVPAGWTWRDGFWLLPAGESFPSPAARSLGQIVSDAGVLAAKGGEHVQGSLSANPLLTVPGLLPGLYRLVVHVDVLNQIAELDETDNVHVSVPQVELRAIDLPLDGFATASLPSGASRWFELIAPADLTVDLELVHDDPNARCELYARRSLPPVLGVHDFAGEGLEAIEPHKQAVRIPRTSGDPYYVLARTVSGAGPLSEARIDAIQRDFGVEDVTPAAIGAGVVTIAIEGFELWRASSVELRELAPGTGVATALEVALLDDTVLLARFDLTGAPLGPREVVLVDQVAPLEAPWSGTIAVEAPLPLALRAELETAPTIRAGETGPGVLRLVNAGNVDLPFAMATLGHARQIGATDLADRVVISSAQLGLDAIETDGELDSLVVLVEDLAPGRSHAIALELSVGAAFHLDEAALGIAAMPANTAALLTGAHQALSSALRVAVAADPATPGSLSSLAQDSGAWDSLVAAALASGAIVVDQGTLHLPDSPVRTARDLTVAIAEGVASELGLPPGGGVPASAVDQVAATAGCAPFAGTAFDCAALFPAECASGSSSIAVTTHSGANVPAGVACTGTPNPDDPNDKLEPNGVGPQQLVQGDGSMSYEVRFENQASASAWASYIEIIDELEPGFRSSSVRFHELRVGRTTLAFPANSRYVQEQVLLAIDAEREVLMQVSALVDAATDTIRVVLLALDPLTGLPSSAGDFGLLPPNGEGLEELATGYVAFSVRPQDLSAESLTDPVPYSGQRRRNSARIVFNANPPIQTNTTDNTLDGGAPVSALTVESVSGPEILLSWTADDTEQLPDREFAGSGVGSYSLYRAPTEAGPWTAILSDTTATSHLFVAPTGGLHAFKLEAKDKVGNEETKTLADATVVLFDDCNANGIPDDDDIANGTSQDCDGNGIPDECDIAAGTHTDLNGNGIPDICECTASSFCDPNPNSTGLATRLAASGLPSLSTGSFALQISDGPPNQPGIFIYATGTQDLPFGDGVLCIGGSSLVRLDPVLFLDASGSASLTLNFAAPPLGSGPDAVQPGDTRHFQFWHRDPHLPGGQGFNLSDAMSVTFCE